MPLSQQNGELVNSQIGDVLKCK